MIRRPPRSTRTDTLFPYTTLFRSPRSGIPRLATSKERRLDGGYQKGGSSPSGSRPVYVAECLDHGCGGIGIARICAETVADESKPGSSVRCSKSSTRATGRRDRKSVGEGTGV